MSTDKKPEDQITEAGAVELDESELDEAAGGLLPAVKTTASPTTPSAPAYEGWPAKYHG